MTNPDVIDPQHTLDTLRAARMRIRAGWTRNQLGAVTTHFGGVCAMGALCYADDTHFISDQGRLTLSGEVSKHITELLAQAIGELHPTSFERGMCGCGCQQGSPISIVMHFNDNRAKNIYDMLAVFDRAIQLAEDLLYGAPEPDPLPEVTPAIVIEAHGGGTITLPAALIKWEHEDPFDEPAPVHSKDLVCV